MPSLSTLRALVVRLQWRRGLRAAIAVALTMLLCRALRQPFGWAALGAFESILVDNGGPYRSRLHTILTLLAGGAVAGSLGSLAGGMVFTVSGSGGNAAQGWLTILLAMLLTAVVCFSFTFARILTQPVASTSVIILVIYFCGVGSSERSLAAIASHAIAFMAGGGCAAAISLFLWPIDPFRPARLSVAEVYRLLAEATAKLAEGPSPLAELEEHRWKRLLRMRIEEARLALSQTAARAPARTLRAQNLAVLLETADMLLARILRMAELAEVASADETAALHAASAWISSAEVSIAEGLRRAPRDGGALFASPAGQGPLLTPDSATEGGRLHRHLAADEREAQQEIAIAFNALAEVWSGESAGSLQERRADTRSTVLPPQLPSTSMREKLRTEWTLQSTMLRHALRMACVGAVDLLLLHFLHISHGFWLGLTSVIVLQPSGSGTMRRGLQRVGGTLAGGVFAAVLAVLIHDPAALMVIVPVFAGLTLACFAVEYTLYSFFLTPTFVLLSLPYLRDWRFAGVRMLTTLLGAVVAIIAMRLLWPGREQQELTRLLRAGAEADAAYMRAVLQFWHEPTPEQRGLLADARRACGLSSNTAEEMLDRLLLQPSFRTDTSKEYEYALSFTTYLRRLTQSLATLASLGVLESAALREPAAVRLELLSTRLNGLLLPDGVNTPPRAVASQLPTDSDANDDDGLDLLALQLQRVERQVNVLERAAGIIAQAELPGATLRRAADAATG